MVSRYYLTVGNLVNQDQTLLTTVVSLDPMYAYFDVDEPTVLRVRKAINEGRIQPRASGMRLPVLMGLQGEEGFPHEGEVDFVNNQLNPTTGSILIRGVFPNPKPAGGVRLLSPGMFVRIRLPIGQPHPATLVIDRAVLSDQGLKYVYVVDAEQHGAVSPGHHRPAPGRRPAGDHRGAEARRMGRRGGACSRSTRTIAIVPEPIPMPTLEPARRGRGDRRQARTAAARPSRRPPSQNTR